MMHIHLKFWVHTRILFPQHIVVELKEMDAEQYESILSMLSDAFVCLNIGYTTGTMLTNNARKIQPH